MTSTDNPKIADFPARGKILSVQGGTVVFQPGNTNYELHLQADADVSGVPVGVTVSAIIRVQGRKLWTVPSGGNFIDPIYGSPRRIQGRIKYLDETQMVVQAGTPIVVTLPTSGEGFDLPEGPLAVGGLVNVSALPGATIELLRK